MIKSLLHRDRISNDEISTKKGYDFTKSEVLPVKMDKILKQAQKMQAQMMKIQEELKAKEVEAQRAAVP